MGQGAFWVSFPEIQELLGLLGVALPGMATGAPVQELLVVVQLVQTAVGHAPVPPVQVLERV